MPGSATLLSAAVPIVSLSPPWMPSTPSGLSAPEEGCDCDGRVVPGSLRMVFLFIWQPVDIVMSEMKDSVLFSVAEEAKDRLPERIGLRR